MPDTAGALIQIGNLARQLGITTRTIRYYEEIGLLGASGRIEGGARTYSHDDVLRLKFILKLKELGITLKEMQALSENFDTHNQSFDKITPQLLDILDMHVATLDQKVSRLSSLRKDIINYRARIETLLRADSTVP